MKNMNVGLVVTGFDKGGLEQVVFNLYKGYKDNGINAYILCEKEELMGYFAGKLDDVRDFCIFNSDFVTFISYCYKKKITHLHYHYNISFIDEARKCGIKTLYTIHNVYTWLSDNDICYRSEILRRCDQVVAVSTLVKEYFCHRSGLPQEFVQVISNGIDTHELLNGEKLPSEITRKGLKIDESNFVFAQVASFTPPKHQIGLISVMEKVAAQNPKIKLLLVGNVLDKEYYELFKNLLKKSSAKDNIIEVAFFDHKYMGKFLKDTVDCAILTTLQEGCSNSVIEALCCEKPLLITNVGNALDVKDKVSAIVPTAYENLYEINNIEIQDISRKKYNINTDDIANKMIEICNNISEYCQKAKCSDSDIEEFDSNNMVNKYIKILEEMK